MFINFISLSKVEASEQRAVVVRVIDINKVMTSTGDVIKLYGISTQPYKIFNERYKEGVIYEDDYGNEYGISPAFFKGKSVEEIYDEGIEFLNNIVLKKEVTFVSHGEEYIILLDNELTSLNELIIKRGYAITEENLKYSSNSFDAKLILSQYEAKANRFGGWEVLIFSKSITPPMTFTLEFPIIIFQAVIFLVALIHFYFYYKKPSIINSVGFYLLCILNAQLITFYDPTSSYNLLLISCVLNIILLILCILSFISMIHKQNKFRFKLVVINIFLLIIFIIITFGSIYYSVSNSQAGTQISITTFYEFQLLETDEALQPIGNYIYKQKEDIDNLNYLPRFNFYSFTYIDGLYFSATTFLNGSYGDMYPYGKLKHIAVLQMILGYFLQVVLFSLLVSKYINSISKEKSNSDEENLEKSSYSINKIDIDSLNSIIREYKLSIFSKILILWKYVLTIKNRISIFLMNKSGKTKNNAEKSTEQASKKDINFK